MAVLEKEFTYAPPGMSGSPVPLKERYDNFIGGRWSLCPSRNAGSTAFVLPAASPTRECFRST